MQQMEVTLDNSAPSENPPFTDWRGNMIRLLQGREQVVALPDVVTNSAHIRRQNDAPTRKLVDFSY
jgi:hypothetical protein